MIPRSVHLPEKSSYFLFGARGTGKSWLLKQTYPQALIFDLLERVVEQNLFLDPGSFTAQVRAHFRSSEAPVVVDEIQKVPWLLDEVHRLLEGEFPDKQFVLTGSSARKLKAGGANLLAGRASIRSLFPFSSYELGNQFELNRALQWGTLPKVWNATSDEQRFDILEAYALTYLKEEVWAEQIIRKLEPFRRFLEVAAQCNGKIINASSIARDVGANPKTVQGYYEILEDTLLGFHLDAFHFSLRKRLKTAPKFYLFDNGVARALSRSLNIPLKSQTSQFGELFEAFVVNEIHKMNIYGKLQFKLSYLQTAAGVEIDLVIERPGKPVALVEIRSAQSVRADHLTSLNKIAELFPDAEVYCLSLEIVEKVFGRVRVMHWQKGIAAICEKHSGQV